jgi:hypothetical protein
MLVIFNFYVVILGGFVIIITHTGEIDMTIITQNRWNVRIVPVGGTRGTSNSLINTQNQPIVEFFDKNNTQSGENNLGQFVQAYCLSTLLERDTAGLDLYASVPEWKVSRDDMLQITHQLHAWNDVNVRNNNTFVIVFHFEGDEPMVRAVQSANSDEATLKLVEALSSEYDMDCVEGESVHIDQVQTFTTLKDGMLI